MYLVIGIVLAFIVSFWKDNRSLWNPVLFLLSLISSYVYLHTICFNSGVRSDLCQDEMALPCFCVLLLAIILLSNKGILL